MYRKAGYSVSFGTSVRPPSAAGAVAGVAAAVRGRVEIAMTAGAVGREVKSGEPIYLGNAVKSGADSGMQIILLDHVTGGRAIIVDWKTGAHIPKAERLAKRLQTIVYRYVLAAGGDGLNGGQPIPPERIEMIYWYADHDGETLRFRYDAAQFAADDPQPHGLHGAGAIVTARGLGSRFLLQRDFPSLGGAASVNTCRAAGLSVEQPPEDVIAAVLDKSGYRNMLKSTGFGAYDSKIQSEMRSWRYRPYMMNGRAVPVCTAVTFIYSQH